MWSCRSNIGCRTDDARPFGLPVNRIEPVSHGMHDAIQQAMDAKTKPVGSLGRLEELARRICAVQQTLSPSVRAPHIVVFAGDHGIAGEGVTAYPQSVTWQMVHNFLSGGAAINVFARLHNIELRVVDAGVNHDFPDAPGLCLEKIAYGTRSFLREPAMSREQCALAMDRGAAQVASIAGAGCNVIGFGEMGIGNSSSAAVIMSLLCGIPLPACVGRGAGLDDEGLTRKTRILEQAVSRTSCGDDALEVLAAFGGFEIAMMAGAFRRAAMERMLILVDGFIATAAVLVMYRTEPAILDYCVFSHRSSERGHGELLRYLGVEPLLDLGMRLGEGTGAALTLPLVRAAVSFMNEMASFASAGVDAKHP